MMIRSTHITQEWSAFFAVLLGIIFCATAFWNTDPEVYLFPRIATGFMLLLALMQWASVVIHRKQHPDTIVKQRRLEGGLAWRALLPGILVGVGYVLVMERLGFYVSSLLTFVIITSIYGKHNALAGKSSIYRVAYNFMVGLIFVAILYALFWKLLNVRTPTGLLF